MQNPIRSVFTLATSLCVVALGHDAQAQLDLGILQANAPQTTFSQFRSRGGDRVPLLVHLPTSDAALADAEGLLRLSPELYATRERPDALSGLIGKYPNWRWLWSPPRRLFLDKVVKNVHADIAQKDFGRTGRGVAYARTVVHARRAEKRQTTRRDPAAGHDWADYGAQRRRRQPRPGITHHLAVARRAG